MHQQNPLGRAIGDTRHREPRLLRNAVATLFAVAALGLSAIPASAATAAGPTMVASTTPAPIAEGTIGNRVSLTFTAASGSPTKGDVAIVIPAGWTAPSLTAGTDGRVFVAASSCTSATISSIAGSGPWTVTAAVKCNGGRGFSLAYGDGVQRLTAPAAGTYPFTTSVRTAPSGPFVPVAAQPGVTVVSAPDVRISVSPSSPIVAAGDPAVFDVAIDNHGAGAAQQVAVLGMLPSATGQTWSVVPPIGCLIAPDHTLQCRADVLQPGATWTFQVIGTTSVADCPRGVLLIVSVNAANEPQSVGGDNSSSAQIPVSCGGS